MPDPLPETRIDTAAETVLVRGKVWYRRPAVWWSAAVVAGGIGWATWRAVSGPEVAFVTPTRGALVHKVVSSGRVMTPARIQLGSTVIGKVIRVLAEEGDVVKAGEILVELRDAEQQASVIQARAGLAQARARAGVVGQVVRRTAEASVDESRSNLDQARRQAERTRILFQSGALTQEQVDDANGALAVAESRLRSAEIASESARPGGSDFSVSSAGVYQAEAALRAAEARLAEMRIEAPAEGVVLRREVEPGDVVQPGRRLLVIARSGPTQLSVQADEKNLAVLRLGQKAMALADALPDQPFEARVSFIAPGVDADRGTVEVRLSVPKPPSALRPDMTVSVNVEVGYRPATLMVPERVVADRNTSRPWVLVAENHRAAKRDVRVGIQGDGVVEVVEGLGENDQVLARNAPGVAPGQRVRPRLAGRGDAL